MVRFGGFDTQKEMQYVRGTPDLVRRGMSYLLVDGPGQGMSNLRKIRVTADNHERATSACVDWLTKRPEVDPERIGVMGISMGSYWSNRLAARDSRVKAIASSAANYGTKKAIFEEASPRFKQIFMYMAGIHDEAEFDRMAEKMHLFGYGPKVRCFSLMVLGEYDPLCHLEEGVAYFQEVAGPKEIVQLVGDDLARVEWVTVATKGIETRTLRRPSEVLAETLPSKLRDKLVVLATEFADDIVITERGVFRPPYRFG